MKRKRNSLLFICGAGAELTWLYAWASFLLLSAFQQLYPLPEAIGVFTLAAFLTLVPRRREWRMIRIIGSHLIGLACAGLWIVYVFYYRSEPFWGFAWLTEFLNRPRDVAEWFLLVFVLAFTIVFWVSGSRFALRAGSRDAAFSRFDKGLAAFFVLFLIKLVMQTQMGMQFSDSIDVLLIFPYFIFALMQIGLIRNQGNDGQKDYLAGYWTVGVFASFTLGVLILGTAVFLLFLPYLQSASAVGYDLMKSAAKPLVPVLIAVLRFLFGYARSGPAAPESSSSPIETNIPPAGETGGWLLFVEKVLAWGGGLLLLVLLSIVAGLGLWYLTRWLFAKRPGTDEKRAPLDIFAWWARLKTFLGVCHEWLLQHWAKSNARHYYTALLRWGRHSGLPHTAGETPLEYARRLAQRFPKLKNEILLIIDLFHREIYGESILSCREIIMVHKAWNNLCRPSHWSSRLKALMSPGAR